MIQRSTNAARPRPGRGVFAAAALLAVLAVLLWWRSPANHHEAPAQAVAEPPAASASAASTQAQRTATDAAIAAAPTAPGALDTAPAPPNWPASLRDSAPDGEVTLDAAGRVRASLELRRLFDYFLSAIGELDVAAIRALLLAHVRGLHGEAVAAEVIALFDRYVDYQHALQALPTPIGESLRERLARVRELRRRVLDPAMADAFFADEERYTEYSLDRRDLVADRSLDAATRDARLAELDARLPPEQRARMQEANAAVLIDEQNRQFAALDLDPAQRQAEREALFGAEAAARLAAVDAEQAAWERRVAAYVQARDAIRADPALAPAARERAIAALRARSFDAAEQRRIGSLEAIGQL
jgi:lipase chaperone LimK